MYYIHESVIDDDDLPQIVNSKNLLKRSKTHKIISSLSWLVHFVWLRAESTVPGGLNRNGGYDIHPCGTIRFKTGTAVNIV